jgi:protein TonB
MQRFAHLEGVAVHAAESHPPSLSMTWESPWRGFLTSVQAFFFGPRMAETGSASDGPYLRVYWIGGRLPGQAFVASSLWHVAAVLILLLPIWRFPNRTPDLAPLHIELMWDPGRQELPPISLLARGPKLKLPTTLRKKAGDTPVQRGADAFHPRQTILSMPIHITHPAQTLIQPHAPPAPPKIEPKLPNIVQWAGTAPQPKLFIPAAASAPRIQHRDVRELAAPDVPNLEENAGPLNIGSSPAVKMPQMPVSPMSARVPERHQRHTDTAAAPEIGPVGSEGDASLRRLIALSPTPAPPAPEVIVPQGNLAARIAISPDGSRPSAPGGLERGSPGGSPGPNGNGVSAGAANGGGGANSPPAAVSVSGGNANTGNGGIAPAGSHSGGKMILKPMKSLPDRPDPMISSRTGPSVVGNIDPSMPPEKILSGKEVYTTHINLPNLTSATGSWILNFAQLQEDRTLSYKLKGKLSAPAPLRKVDPKYPPALVREHVDGEVILYAIIRKSGAVDSIQLVRGIDPQLDKNAMDALAQWQFRPAAREGVTTDVEVVVYIPFRFRKPEF